MTDTFLTDRLTAIEAQIIAYEGALTAISDGAQSYSLDTGQTVQRVTRANLEEVQRAYQSLLNLRATIRNRCGLDDGVHTASPGY